MFLSINWLALLAPKFASESAKKSRAPLVSSAGSKLAGGRALLQALVFISVDKSLSSKLASICFDESDWRSVLKSSNHERFPFDCGPAEILSWILLKIWVVN